MNSTIAGFIALSLSAPAAFAAAPSAAPARPPASFALTQSVARFARAGASAAGPAAPAALTAFARLDAANEFHREVAGQLGLTEDFAAQAEDALRAGDPAGLDRISSRFLQAGREGGRERVDALVKARAEALLEDVRLERVSVMGLLERASELSAFSGYHPSAALVARVAEAARTRTSLEAGREIAAELADGAVELAAVEPAPASSPEIAEARARVQGLAALSSPRVRLQYAHAMVIDGAARGEEFQRVTARGLADAARDDKELLDPLARLAASSIYHAVHRIAIEAVMRDAAPSGSREHMARLSMIKAIAAKSTSPAIKREVADRLAEAAAAVPGRRAEIYAGAPADGRRAPPPSEAAFLAHPFAWLAALAAGGLETVLVLVGTAPLGVVGMLAAAAVAGLMMRKTALEGLRAHHPVAAFFQMMLVGGYFVSAAWLGAPSFLTLALAGVGALFALDIARRSYASGKVFNGWAVNLVIRIAFAVVFGI